MNVLVCSWLEPELVERVREVDPRLEVAYHPDLLAPPRYAADHTGAPFQRTPDGEERWLDLLSRAEVLFDYDRTHRDDLPERAPRARWIQFTSAGIGQLIRSTAYGRRMPDTVFTTAAGVHAQPLAEFAVMGILAHSRGLLRVLDAQRRKHWERYAGTDVEGRTALVVGLGGIGTAVARACRALGMRVLGVKRSVRGLDPGRLHVDELHRPDRLHDLLPRADALVLSAPHTPDTEGMIGARELALLPAGAYVVNVGRGALVDEPALVEALVSGHLGGAALDVFRHEPLPPDSPLWDMPNVIVSPHSGSTSDRENARITDLFCDNLRRYLEGAPLVNVLNLDRLY